MAAAHIGYVVVFYVVVPSAILGLGAAGNQLFQDSVNTLPPWLAGAAIGLLGRRTKSLRFRLFAIPFFQRITGSDGSR